MRPIFSGSARPGRLRERPRRSGQQDRARDDVERRAAVDRADGHDGRVERRDLARHHRLQRLDDARGGDDGIGRLVRRRAVSASALDLDLEMVDGGHERAAVDADLADGQGAPEMEAECRADALEHAVVGARLRAALAFLGRLEEEAHRGAGLAGREAPGDREPHRDVPVVSAGVHAARDRRGVGLRARFLQRQRVHVGAEQDAGAGAPVVGDDPGLSHARAGREADRLEPRHDDSRRAVLLEGELGMPVQVAPRGDERLVLRGGELGEEAVERHGARL